MFTSKESSILAGAVLFMMVATGYAISTVEGAIAESSIAIPVVPAVGQDLAPAVYLPAQYVNQAKEVEQHIEAY